MLENDPRIAFRALISERPGERVPWPESISTRVQELWAGVGIAQPWRHQAEALVAINSGSHVVLATGTASGKSLAYQVAVVDALVRQEQKPGAGAGATALYLAPTKALAADQYASWATLRRTLAEGGSADILRPMVCDGDTPFDARDAIRRSANVVLSNPDFLHYSMLPGHQHWRRFLSGLRYVIVDECHHYTGTTGAHVSGVLRRLLRLSGSGQLPQVILASATTANPQHTAEALIGLPVEAVSQDYAERAAREVIFLAAPDGVPSHAQAPVVQVANESDPIVGAETELAAFRSGEVNEPSLKFLNVCAELLAESVQEGRPTVVFCPSRRSVEVVATLAKEALPDDLRTQVAGYRGGYLPEERRELERAVRAGEIVGLAATSALELGVDIAGLDCVVIGGWPGRRSRFWQQAGRAGRRGRPATVVFVASENPLDRFIAATPEFVMGEPMEDTIFDPDNPHILVHHISAAAAEQALNERDLERFGSNARPLVELLSENRLLRRRGDSWFWVSDRSPTQDVALRGGGFNVRIMDESTGVVIGMTSLADVDRTLHPGSIYIHQGQAWRVVDLLRDEAIAVVRPDRGDTYTQALSHTDIQILESKSNVTSGHATWSWGRVMVRKQVHGFRRFDSRTKALVEQVPLDCPEHHLETAATWWTLGAEAVQGVDALVLPGALHAAEHAAIGLLPLFAGCDRWDIGGVSTALHGQTQLPTVFVYDGHPGGAGFSQRGFALSSHWWSATRRHIQSCACDGGCPLCVLSPKCGNGNEPLDKLAAVEILDLLLARHSTQDAQLDELAFDLRWRSTAGLRLGSSEGQQEVGK